MPPIASSVLLWKAGAALTATGITAGAFGSHALAARLGEKAASWSTASHYAIANGVALLAISQHPVFARRWAPLSIAAGTVLFSGSIFTLLLLKQGNALRKVLGPTTPLGGLLMIGGYVGLLL